jgi:hypothetical protein
VRFECVPVADRGHQVWAANYVAKHGAKGAAVWSVCPMNVFPPICHRSDIKLRGANYLERSVQELVDLVNLESHLDGEERLHDAPRDITPGCSVYVVPGTGTRKPGGRWGSGERHH